MRCFGYAEIAIEFSYIDGATINQHSRTRGTLTNINKAAPL